MDHPRLPIGPVRQRTSVVMGAVGLVLAGVLLVDTVWSGGDLSVVALLLLLGALSLVVLVRPSLTLANDGIHLANPLRRTVIPWVDVDEIRTLWNLELGTATGRHTAWAISASRHRPRAHASVWPSGGRRGRAGAQDTLTTAGGATGPDRRGAGDSDAVAIGELVRQIHDEVVGAGGRPGVDGLAPSSPTGTTSRWDVVNCAALAVPLVLLVAGLMT